MQTKRWSVIESVANIAVGLGVAFASNMLVLPLFGFNVQPGQAVWITAIFTAISFVRSYWLRRAFNWFHSKGEV